MAANTSPIFTNVPKISWGKVSAADGSSDGTDADVVLVFTADATDGSYLQKLLFTPRSTAGSTSTSATAARVYLNNGSSVGTGTNNVLIGELTFAAINVNLTSTTGIQTFTFPMNIQIPPGYRIYVGLTAVAANTNWDVVALGGDY